MSSTPRSILVIEDSPIVRAGIAAVLSTHGDLRIAAEAQDAESAMRAVRAAIPDAILLDWRVPGANGDRLCRELRDYCPETGILVLTSAGDPATLRSALEAGADGFLLKETDGRMLASAVRAVAEGRTVFDPNLSEMLGSLFRSGPADATRRNDAFGALAAADLRIIELLAAGMTNKEIGNQLGIAEKTVKNHLTRIFNQLGIRTRVQAATLWLERSRSKPSSP